MAASVSTNSLGPDKAGALSRTHAAPTGQSAPTLAAEPSTKQNSVMSPRPWLAACRRRQLARPGTGVSSCSVADELLAAAICSKAKVWQARSRTKNSKRKGMKGPKLGTYSDWGLSSVLVINKHLSHRERVPDKTGVGIYLLGSKT